MKISSTETWFKLTGDATPRGFLFKGLRTTHRLRKSLLTLYTVYMTYYTARVLPLPDQLFCANRPERKNRHQATKWDNLNFSLLESTGSMLQHIHTHCCAHIGSKDFLLKCIFKGKMGKDDSGVLFGSFHRRASGWRCALCVRFSHTLRKEMAVSLSSTSSAAVASILAREKSLMARPSAIFQDLSCKRNAEEEDLLWLFLQVKH